MSSNYATKPTLEVSRNGQKTAISLPKIAQGGFWERVKDRWQMVADTKTLNVPTWAAAVFLGALLSIGGVIYWRLSDKLQESRDSNVRMEQALTDLKDNINDKLKPVEREGLLNDEHLRSLDKDFAEFRGYVRSKNGDDQKGRQ